MKIVKEIFRYIVATILAIALVMIIVCIIINKTVLSKEYVISKLEETGYYSKEITEVNNGFSKYTMQSGLEPEVVNNIVPEEKIKEDTNKIISSIYDGGPYDDLDLSIIETNLKNNIQNFRQGTDSIEENPESIDQLVEVIQDEYRIVIMKTGREDTFHEYVLFRQKIVNILLIASIVIFILFAIMMIILNLTMISRNISVIGMASCFEGILLVYVNYIIKENIYIDGINILNPGMSDALKNIAYELINLIYDYGIKSIIIGIVLIIIGNILNEIFKKDKEKKV